MCFIFWVGTAKGFSSNALKIGEGFNRFACRSNRGGCITDPRIVTLQGRCVLDVPAQGQVQQEKAFILPQLNSPPKVDFVAKAAIRPATHSHSTSPAGQAKGRNWAT